MKLLTITFCGLGLVFLSSVAAIRQDVPERLLTGYEPLDERLSTMVTADSLSISVSAAKELPNAVYLDAREPEEYIV